MITIYAGSLFVVHCTSSDLLDQFFEFMKDLKLDTDLLLSIGMDGPNVNKSFETTLIDKLEKEKGSSFVSLGSCGLHTANTGFGKGVQTLFWGLSKHWVWERGANTVWERGANTGFGKGVQTLGLGKGCN